MRFGGPWVGGFDGRAMAARRSWDPIITNFQRKPHTTAHNAQEHLVTPCAQARWRIFMKPMGPQVCGEWANYYCFYNYEKNYNYNYYYYYYKYHNYNSYIYNYNDAKNYYD